MTQELTTSIAARRESVLAKIHAAALRYGRDPGSVTLLAVSKMQPVESLRVLAEIGQRDFGENYLQEALPKIDALADMHIAWHYIGQIQSNKTRPIAERFDWVHTVDRLKIAQRLSEQRAENAAPLNVCIQVKLAEESGKGGVSASELEDLAHEMATLPRLKLRGLMCIPPPRETFDAQSKFFAETARLYEALRARGLPLDTLSMGMSGDLEAAIAHGATIVRVGTAMFGERQRRDA